MAVRSGAGTGVIVSLIVFIVLTVSMLVLAIVFYSGQTDALEAQKKAEDSLSTYVRANERGTDRFNGFEASATGNTSVSGYLASRYDELSAYVTGGESATLESIQANLQRLGVDPGLGVQGSLSGMNRRANDLSAQIESLQSSLDDAEQQVAESESALRNTRTAHSEEKEALAAEISDYREANIQYAAELRQTRELMEQRVDGLEADHESEINELNRQLTVARTDNARAQDRLDQVESMLEGQRLQARNPALLVDGGVLEYDAANDTVFINRGTRDRMVVGLTFEVYDSATAIRIRPDGTVSPGKASFKVTRTDQGTSSGRLTRTTAGRPVVPGDVIVNAAYDPNRVFKFLVHGNFDVDRDGRATAAEAEFVRSLVIEWGGEVIDGESVPGDLDFLVLGVEPSDPPQPGANASLAQISIWAERKEARQTYIDLKKQASDAKIPILNSNRFFILTGQGG
ncbi:MAG: hypothetical protein AB8G96_00800 [Phycisphaerales bacterium]